ncbi:MAG: hypothetical protein ACQEV7_10710 [Bacillota bacterium]
MHWFTGLFVKDWKLSFKSAWQNVLVILAVWIISIVASIYMGNPYITTAVGILLLVSNLFYISIDICLSLHKETKSMQWLHNPNSVFSLLFSKLVVSFLSFLLSLLASIGLLMLSSIFLDTPIWREKEEVWEVGSLLVNISLTGLYGGVWMLFIWVMMKSVTSRGLLGKVLQVLIALLLLPIISLHVIFHYTPWYERLLSLGTFSTSNIGLNFDAGEGALNFGLLMGEFSFALMGVFFLISILLFTFSAFMMEKKMEM